MQRRTDMTPDRSNWETEEMSDVLTEKQRASSELVKNEPENSENESSNLESASLEIISNSLMDESNFHSACSENDEDLPKEVDEKEITLPSKDISQNVPSSLEDCQIFEEEFVTKSEASNDEYVAPKPPEPFIVDENSADSRQFDRMSILKLRTHMMEVIEELKMRRVNDQESEERLKLLISDKHALMSQNEEHLLEIRKRQEEKEVTISNMKKSQQAKLQSLEQSQTKLQMNIDGQMKEVKILKDEIRNLQMCKYNYEKQMKEQDKRLQLRDDLQTSSLTQLTALETRCKDMADKMKQLMKDQDRMSDNIQEATKLNKKLSNIVDHHDCETKRHKAEITRLKEVVLKLRLELEEQPRDFMDQIRDKDLELCTLRQQNETSNERIKLLEHDLVLNRERKQVLEFQLQTSNELVARHVDLTSQKAQLCMDLEENLSKLTTSHTKLTESYNCTCKELEISEAEHVKLEEESVKQINEMSQELKVLQFAHDTLLKERCDLEELNTKWATKNTLLSQEIFTLKEELNKPKIETGVQCTVDTASCHIQTDSINGIDICMQTMLPHYADCETQTIQADGLEVSIQTVEADWNPKTIQTSLDQEDQPSELTVKSYDDEALILVEEQPGTTKEANNDTRNNEKEMLMAVVDVTLDPQSVSGVAEEDTSSEISDSLPLSQNTDRLTDVSVTGSKANSIDGKQYDMEFDIEMSPYSKFTSTLKTIANMFSPRKTRKSQNDGPVAKKIRAEEVTDLPLENHDDLDQRNAPRSPYKFQFVKNISNKITNVELLSRDKNEETPVGILLDVNRVTRKSKRVTFASKLEHHEDSPPTQQCNSLVEDDLFSEDEVNTIELGSQVERITNFLRHDRLDSA